MNIKRIYIIIFCLVLVSKVAAQNLNPFEIQHRLDPDSTVLKVDNNRVTPSERSENVSQNIFEIEQSTDSIANTNTVISRKIMESSAAEANKLNPFEIDQKPNEEETKASQNEEETKASQNEELKTIKTVTTQSTNNSGNFLFWIILFAFLILAVALSIDRWFITKLFKGIFNYNLSNTMMRETTGIKFIILICLYFLFIITFSLFTFLIYRFYSGVDDIKYLYYSFFGVSTVYIVRHISLHLLKIIFPKVIEALHYSYSIMAFNVVAGILLLIPVLLMAYSASSLVAISLFIGLSIIGALFILRSLRGLLIAFRYINNQPIHFFLYLCAFEIIPLMIVYKILTDFV